MDTSKKLSIFIVHSLLLGNILAAVSEHVGDESCLLQTELNPKTHRQSQDLELLGTQETSGAVPEFEINLDLHPEERFKKIAQHFRPLSTEFFEKFGNTSGVLASSKKMAALRGEETSELMGEIRGLAKAVDMPEYLIHAQQLTAPLMSLKGPYLELMNKEKVQMPEEELLDLGSSSHELLNHMESPSFGNTGIIAKDSKDGSVWHARNFGYALPRWAQKLTYNAKFTKGGKKVFTGQMIFPLVQVFTALRPGDNGYSYQLNTRYLDSTAQSISLFKNLYSEKRHLSGWKARKILENTDNYEDAVKQFSTLPYPSPEYNLISGVKKGVVLARDADGLAYRLDLGKNRYITMTNFDYVNGDKKEWLQPTRVKGVSARVRVQNMLDDSKTNISPELLQQVLNDKDVFSNNVLFQSMINVERGTYSSSLPHCANCDY